MILTDILHFGTIFAHGNYKSKCLHSVPTLFRIYQFFMGSKIITTDFVAYKNEIKYTNERKAKKLKELAF